MKKFIIMAVCVLCAAIFVPCHSQNYTQQGKTFVAQKSDRKAPTRKSKSVNTGYKWKDTDGKEYDIMLSEKGKAYIEKTSKTSGKKYRKYLPDEIAQKVKK